MGTVWEDDATDAKSAASRHLRVRGIAAVAIGAIAALASCGQTEIHGRQLDLVLRTQFGRGTGTSAPAYFPHARYTFFAFEDPTFCLRGVELLDGHDAVVGGETFDRQSELPAVNVPVPLVQKNLPEGKYRLRISTEASGCSWMIQEVLNSMSTQADAPTAAPEPAAPHIAISVDQTMVPIDIPEAGLYEVSWKVTVPPNTTCPYVIALRTQSGGIEQIDQQPEPGTPANSVGTPTATGGTFGGEIVTFLARGTRTVNAVTACPWQVSVAPLTGPNGGGVQGFLG